MNRLVDGDPARWSALALVCTAVLLGLSAWFTASAVAPELAERWSLDAGAVGFLTTVVQLGFVVGTALAAVLNLADVVSARAYFSVSSLLAAASNALLLVVPGYRTALMARFATGFFLAGVYPPAMKMIATWFRSSRGMAIGAVVGALVLGKSAPWLMKAIGGVGSASVILSASAGGVVAAVLVGSLYRDGPYPFARRPFAWTLVGDIVRHRPTMLATGGYLGHMWELYAGWTTLGMFFLAYWAGRGLAGVDLARTAALSTFVVLAAGGVGSLVAGGWADRWGRESVASACMVVSGGCALALGWMLGAPPPAVVGVALLWGVSIVADSAQFSALVTEVSPPHAVGTALTVQTSLGFALTAVSIALTVAVADRFGWGPAFSLLALGPLFGVASMVTLRRVRAA